MCHKKMGFAARQRGGPDIAAGHEGDLRTIRRDSRLSEIRFLREQYTREKSGEKPAGKHDFHGTAVFFFAVAPCYCLRPCHGPFAPLPCSRWHACFLGPPASAWPATMSIPSGGSLHRMKRYMRTARLRWL